ncbi:aminotransferase class V-fold PLP-dependent enzyme [Methylobacillus arboreus]|uniref:pyridoxal phosphate-dependent decarboxylase family protein n=1 Tax=Methylobacillus arboreus TaxID=755170 RepID=UPI001E5B119C|nr:aminotransferase class V-fold PLP-dependent enzyme [Methylobacillus arboreus]MCB5189203.1 aminotransferase class V-fold PLP-dependent enzyme [Methylobacillus arboreus]
MTLAELNHLFDPEQFRVSGHALIDLLAEQLTNQLNGDASLVKWQSPLEAEQAWRQPMPESPEFSNEEFITWLKQEVLPRNLSMHHPHSMAHQAAPPLPIAALCDLVAALSNQAMAVYETGPAATLIERQVIRWLNTAVGWPQGAGVLTSGGSQANLTALLAARQHMGANIWNKGMAATPRLRILTSEFSHYSIRRAAGIMGLGVEAVIAVAVDEQGRMLPQALKQAHEACAQNQEQVMAVVATAGCTPTGSIDPLQEIGEYCRTHGLWLHIDAAHGASALLSEQHRAKLHGMEMADSVTWDGHKLLYMPATVSAVLFRDEAASYSAFAQDASYLFHEEEDSEARGFNTSYRTLECTKRMMGLKLLAAFKLYGRQGMASLVEHAFTSAGYFANLVARTSGFTLLMHPQTNIVCFRYHGNSTLTSSSAMLNELQANIRKKLLHQEMFHLSQVNIGDNIWLRCTFMNPYTQQAHQEQLLKAVACMGDDLSANRKRAFPPFFCN